MTRKTEIDVDTLKYSKGVGKSLPHFAHLFSPRARLIRSNILTILLEAKAKRTIRRREEKLILVLNKIEYCKKELEETRKLFEEKLKELQQKKERGSYDHFIMIIIQVKERALKKFLDKLEVEKKQLIDTTAEDNWAFIQKLIAFRSQDEQVDKVSKADAGDVLAISSIIAGAMDKQKELNEKNNGEKIKEKG